MKKIFALLVFILFILTSFVPRSTTEIRNDFKKYYDQYKVEGSFVLYDQNNNKFIIYNNKQFKESFSPASTFKICNSLIGLETGVIKDENFVIAWDSVVRQNINWNKDHDLKTAYKNSTVWYYRELARRVGGEKMKYWLDKCKYGNADTSGGLDLFWLKGGLKITPEQQIQFLRKLHDNKLPFSQRSMDIVKKIMIAKDTLGYVIRSKTGLDDRKDRLVGWYVGYIEKDNNVYYFSNCIQSNDINNNNIPAARKAISIQILNELKITNEK